MNRVLSVNLNILRLLQHRDQRGVEPLSAGGSAFEGRTEVDFCKAYFEVGMGRLIVYVVESSGSVPGMWPIMPSTVDLSSETWSFVTFGLSLKRTVGVVSLLMIDSRFFHVGTNVIDSHAWVEDVEQTEGACERFSGR